MTSTDEPSYIDYEAFLSPSFSAASFANNLVLSTNNASDSPLDLTTPLSRVLFDVQEIDTHIDALSTKSALPILTHVQDQTVSADRILTTVDAQVASLTEGYKRLEKEVLHRYEVAEEVRQTSERLWATVKLGRAVARCLQLGRQLEVQMGEVTSSKADHRGLVRAAHTLLALRSLFDTNGPGEEGEGLHKVNAVVTLRNEIIAPSERTIKTRAQQIVREFSLSNLSAASGSMAASTTYAQTEETKARTISALSTLYLLSATPRHSQTQSQKPLKPSAFEPDLLISALQEYLRSAYTSSVASMTRSLGTLPTLDRTLLEVSARCQNIIALEVLLSSNKPPPHPLLSSSTSITPSTFLQPLLHALETGSLPSWFWRTLGSGLGPRVQELMHKGGVPARTLRTNKNSVRDSIRECVMRGSQPPPGAVMHKAKADAIAAGWDREVAVMVGSVWGNIK